jgi:hypothetical protein
MKCTTCNVYIVALSRNMIHIRYSHSPIPNLTTNSQAKILKRGMEIQRIYIYKRFFPFIKKPKISFPIFISQKQYRKMAEK